MYESFFGMEHTPFVRDVPPETGTILTKCGGNPKFILYNRRILCYRIRVRCVRAMPLALVPWMLCLSRHSGCGRNKRKVETQL